jgi:hypothetical protein
MSTLGSNLSDGLSLKAPPGYPHDYSVNSSQTASSKLGYNYANANEDGDGLTRSCCFGNCETSPNNCTQQFCGCDDSADRNNNCSCLFRCCSFKKRSDCGFCAVLSLLLTCLFIGVIGPLAMNSLIDSEINSELVIDSTSAPAYKVWQTNAEGKAPRRKSPSTCTSSTSRTCRSSWRERSPSWWRRGLTPTTSTSTSSTLCGVMEATKSHTTTSATSCLTSLARERGCTRYVYMSTACCGHFFVWV